MAFIGAIVLIGLTNTFTSTVTSDSRISAEVSTQVGVATGSGLSFVSSTQVEHAAQQAGLDKATTAALVDDYETAQLRSLEAGLLGAALLALISLAFTWELPHDRPAPRKRQNPQFVALTLVLCRGLALVEGGRIQAVVAGLLATATARPCGLNGHQTNGWSPPTQGGSGGSLGPEPSCPSSTTRTA